MASSELWEKTFRYLKDNGLDVYPPATKRDECKKDYCVLKGDGSAPIYGYTSENQYYLILCYSKTYSGVLKYVDLVKNIMEEYAPQMMPTGNETTPFYDEGVKAHMVSIQYRASARNTRLNSKL